MTSASMQAVAAENQRRRIPDKVLIRLEEVTNDELAWLATNGKTTELRSYAGWELEYREAFDIEAYIDFETNEIKRRRQR